MIVFVINLIIFENWRSQKYGKLDKLKYEYQRS